MNFWDKALFKRPINTCLKIPLRAVASGKSAKNKSASSRVLTKRSSKSCRFIFSGKAWTTLGALTFSNPSFKIEKKRKIEIGLANVPAPRRLGLVF